MKRRAGESDEALLARYVTTRSAEEAAWRAAHRNAIVTSAVVAASLERHLTAGEQVAVRPVLVDVGVADWVVSR